MLTVLSFFFVHILKMLRDCFVWYQQNINDIKQSDHLFKSNSQRQVQLVVL